MRSLVKLSARNMRSTTVPTQVSLQAPFLTLPAGDLREDLWMKFPGRNIYSTCCDKRFRRSGPRKPAKNFDIHRVPHRLCTRYAPYCTGYPQHARHAGFAAGAAAASVAGYLFSVAPAGRVRSGLTLGAAPFTGLCGKAVDSGDNFGGRRSLDPPTPDCQGLRVNLDRWRSR